MQIVCALSSQDGVKNWSGQRKFGDIQYYRLYAQFSSQLGPKNVAFSEKTMRPGFFGTITQVLKSEIIHECAGGRKIQENNYFFKIWPLFGLLRENFPKSRQLLQYLNGLFFNRNISPQHFL